jgi:hypothetical protein
MIPKSEAGGEQTGGGCPPASAPIKSSPANKSRKRSIPDPARKPRPDAILKTLPEERQEAIVEFARTHSLAKTVTWLGESGIIASQSMISKFLPWFDSRQQMFQNESAVEAILERWKRENPGWTQEELDAAGQRFFTEMALKQQDSLCWKRAQDIQVRNKSLGLMERRLQLQERKEEQAKKTTGAPAGSQMTPEEKEAEYKRILGID